MCGVVCLRVVVTGAHSRLFYDSEGGRKRRRGRWFSMLIFSLNVLRVSQCSLVLGEVVVEDLGLCSMYHVPSVEETCYLLEKSLTL